MISTSTLTTALSNEHAGDLRREAMRPRAAGQKPRGSRARIMLAAAAVAGVALFASAPAWAASPTYYASSTAAAT